MTGASVQRRLPALLRDPGPFRYLFWGQALSVLGDRVVPIAIAFGVLGIGSTTDLGLVLAAGGIPFALFAIVGGVLSDRLGRRNVMIAADLLRVVVQAATATLLITGTAQVWMLAALSFAYGLSAASFMPAFMGLIPQVVRAGAAAGGQRAHRADPQPRERRRARRWRARSSPSAARARRSPSTRRRSWSARPACCGCAWARARGARRAPRDAGFLDQLREGWHEVRTRPWLRWGLVAMASYHVFVLPSVLVLGPTLAERELGGASSWAVIVAVLGRRVDRRQRDRPAPARARPVFVAALALVGASLQAAVIGSGLGPPGSPCSRRCRASCVALFFTLWDTSCRSRCPGPPISRVSLLRLHRLDGPDAHRHGARRPGRRRGRPARDARRHERHRRRERAGWLAQPSVRALRRPERAVAEEHAPAPEVAAA